MSRNGQEQRDLSSTPDFGAFVPGAHHIELASGGYLDLADPDPHNIRLDDVAHGLAHTCRFAGQCRKFYSVAEHAVLVAMRLRGLGAVPAVQLAGLHHDDAEAYLGDVTRPLKALVTGYGDLEAKVMAAVRIGLDIRGLWLDAPEVKEADNWALAAESYHLLGSRGSTWFCAGLYDPADATSPRLFDMGMKPRNAKALWLSVHYDLCEALGLEEAMP